MPYSPVMVLPLDPNGKGTCTFQGEKLAIDDAEVLVSIANGGRLACQECMAAIIEQHPEAVTDEWGNPVG